MKVTRFTRVDLTEDTKELAPDSPLPDSARTLCAVAQDSREQGYTGDAKK